MTEESKTSTTMNGNGSSNGHGSSKSINDSKYLAQGFINKYTLSFVLKSVLTLGIPDILNTEEGKPLTAEEILAKLPTAASPPTAGSVKNLSRTLRILVLEGFFSESLNDKRQSVYGLTDISKWFVKTTKYNMLPMSDFQARSGYDQPAIYSHLPEAILDDSVVPFEAHYGMTGYEYVKKNPNLSVLFQNLMIAFSNMEVDTVIKSLEKYNVLEGVNTIVDVGGGTGRNVADIIAKYQHIKGFNLDLPHVIAHAPQVEGLTHVPGNMFESVPSGNAILLKWVLHNYDDGDGVKILKNCFKALPEKGKVIVIEYVLADGPDSSPRARMTATSDHMMLMYMGKGARERTKTEYQELIAAAGFSRSEFIQDVAAMDLIVAYKE